MQIVLQSASLSYSLIPFPSRPLLSAPPVRLAIAAPRIAGLLPATVPLQGEVVIDEPLTFAALMQQIGPIRSGEALNAEIAEIACEALQFMRNQRDRRGDRRAAQGWQS